MAEMARVRQARVPGVIEAPGFQEPDMEPIFRRMARSLARSPASRHARSRQTTQDRHAQSALDLTLIRTVLFPSSHQRQEDGGAFPEGYLAFMDLLEAVSGPSEIPERFADLRGRLRSLPDIQAELAAVLQGEGAGGGDSLPQLSLAAMRALSAWGFFGSGRLDPSARFAAAGVPLESSAKIQVYWRNFVRAATAVMPGTVQVWCERGSPALLRSLLCSPLLSWLCARSSWIAKGA